MKVNDKEKLNYPLKCHFFNDFSLCALACRLATTACGLAKLACGLAITVAVVATPHTDIVPSVGPFFYGAPDISVNFYSYLLKTSF